MNDLNVNNPFYFGNEVCNDDFCNRITELAELQRDVRNGINVLLYAPRRFGKTSILKKIQKTLNKKSDYKVIFFDFFTVSNIDEFMQNYFNTLINSLETKPQKALKMLREVLNIHPNINMNINTNGDISYNLSITKKEQDNSLVDILNLPFEYAKKYNKKVLVIFDEFQEIEQLNIEKKLRSIIQSHSRKVSYIFSGSKQSILIQMFSDKQRAFYKPVKHLNINEILFKDWQKFIKHKFTRTQKEINKYHIQQAFDITNGFPYYMQQLMYFVWQATHKQVDGKIIDSAIKLMLEREHDFYSIIWTNLTPNQKRTLKYIINTAGIQMYNKDNLSDFDMNATTLKSTLSALIKKDICDKKNNVYYLLDPFMAYWLRQYS